jgi:hypothetical protein
LNRAPLGRLFLCKQGRLQPARLAGMGFLLRSSLTKRRLPRAASDAKVMQPWPARHAPPWRVFRAVYTLQMLIPRRCRLPMVRGSDWKHRRSPVGPFRPGPMLAGPHLTDSAPRPQAQGFSSTDYLNMLCKHSEIDKIQTNLFGTHYERTAVFLLFLELRA